MRPLNLHLQNFGPYEDTTIDFTRFDAAPLFLVTGNTGSGKTTIFDAMVFALFNETTNNKDRGAGALRADFAKDGDETAVTFTFTHANRTYTVTRKPKQRSARGAERPAKVSLTFDRDGERQEMTRIHQVDQFLSDLLGLTKDQFRQLVLLPQGQFRRVLTSSSNEKEELLESLFATHLYAAWTARLKDQLAARDADSKDRVSELAGLKKAAAAVTLPNDQAADNAAWLTAAHRVLADQDEGLAKISREIESNQAALSAATAQVQAAQSKQEASAAVATLTAQQAELAAQEPAQQALAARVAELGWFQDHQATYLSWQQATSTQESASAAARQAATSQTAAERAASQATAQVDQLSAQAAQVDEWKATQARLEGLLPEIAARDRLSAAAASQERAVAELTSQLTAARQQVESAQAAQTTATDQLTAIGDLGKEELAVQRQGDRLARWQEQQRALAQQAAQLADRWAQESAARQAASQAAAAAARAQEALATTEDAFARSAIARLLPLLKADQPCPLCGSTDHPHPVVPARMAVTEDELKAARKAAQAARDAANRTASDLAHQAELARAAADQLTAGRQQLAAELKVAPDAAPLAAALEQAGQAHQQATAKLTAAKQARQRAEAAATVAQKSLTQAQAALEKLTPAHQAAREELTRLTGALESKRQLVGTRQAAPTKEEIARLKRQVADYAAAKQAADQALATATTAVTTARTQRTQLAAQEKAAAATAKQAQEDLVTALAAAYPDRDWTFFAQAAAALAQLPALRDQRVQYQQAVATTADRLADAKQRLAKVATALPLASAQEKQATAQATLNQAQQERGHQQAAHAQLQSQVAEVQRLVDQQAAAEAERAELATLVAVMRGDTGTKLSLERYVLQSYFSQVLTLANQYLVKLSNQRYTFELDEGSGHGNGTKWSGLEIAVFDHYAGRARSARTLSGGESFIASLSLALGLSELIQQQTGGIQIEALFIDEGFGSLDPQALQKALSALLAIQDSRMIGVISHISELKEQIADQLVVTNTAGKSTISYRSASQV